MALLIAPPPQGHVDQQTPLVGHGLQQNEAIRHQTAVDLSSGKCKKKTRTIDAISARLRGETATQEHINICAEEHSRHVNETQPPEIETLPILNT